ncbi:ABC transporter substrate-binding protein [Arthrobacter koreensis]|uniref:ABC transporter substrate-binding protein n=1 Tax=Arthrobacter koreensis TaxID=199136 RepID=UPI002DB5BC35|nr:ABC transporter substrate-binding protein [Arthrobacter koreensis]MEB7502972.1 ABC transporter substrate-binding protein [Arthrobacter koreensis]
MPQPVNAGSVLGGRYKVTAQVLASAENDLVLDGVDQVLNRAVSILVAAPQNASQVSASAREIAIGERHSTVQILDLGVSDGRTYLVTSNGNAADLLDLVIERDAPYVEPFFTDTLGSEIFGVARSHEPETVEEDRYVEEHAPRDRKPLLSNLPKPHLPRFGRGAGAAGTAAAGAASAEAERDLEFGGPQETPAEAATGAAVVPPPPSQSPRTAGYSAPTRDTPVQSPKVSRWEDEDDFPAEGYASAGSGDRRASNFPRTALASDYETEEAYDGYDDEDTPARDGERKTGRLLIGGILSVILVVAVVLVFTNLGRVGDMFASDEPTSTVSEPPAATEAPAQESGAALPAPVTAGITRLVPGNQELDSVNDAALPQIIDGNESSYWSSYVYASDTFGGLAPSLALVVELEEESAITKVDITQLNGSGGNFSVMLNDSPSLEGATTVAQSGFTGPTTSIAVPKGADGEPASASYVIINFTQLPRLSGVQAEYPWGLRIAEIGVS